LGISSNEGFQLVKNIEGGKVMSNKEKQTIKVLMFLERCTVRGLIESYFQFAAWNVQVDSFRVVKRIRNNTFLAQLRLKKKNFFSFSREAFFIASYFKLCSCLGGQFQSEGSTVKHYLIMTQVDGREQ
jgi:hypothetical protein